MEGGCGGGREERMWIEEENNLGVEAMKCMYA